MTRGEYNHVSVAMDPHLSEIYSFARLALHTPFCGGFVREGCERFGVGTRRARVAICAIDVDEKCMRAVRGRIREMIRSGPERYVYNMFSAACVPIKRRVRIRDSYTCIEFAVSLLLTAGFPIRDRYYSLKELYMILSPFEIYRGRYPDGTLVVDPSYGEKIPAGRCVSRTTRQLWRMTKRFIGRGGGY